MAMNMPMRGMSEKMDMAEDAADTRRGAMNKGKLPGLSKMPKAAMMRKGMKKGR